MGEGRALSAPAGTKAFERAAARESATYFDQALAALARLPQTRETVEQVIDVRFDLCLALQQLGELERCIEDLHEAERLAGPSMTGSISGGSVSISA